MAHGWGAGLSTWMPEYLTSQDEQIDVHLSIFLVNVACLPGNIASVNTVRTLGRNKTLGFSALLSAGCVLFVLFVASSWEMVGVLCAFNAVNVATWNALNILNTESAPACVRLFSCVVCRMFPTDCRSTAYGLLASIGRLGSVVGNLVFGLFSDVSFAVPLICCASFFLTGVLRACCACWCWC